jgi:proliferating cell nuclear antigen
LFSGGGGGGGGDLFEWTDCGLLIFWRLLFCVSFLCSRASILFSSARMEATLESGLVMRKVLEALRELVTEANLRWSSTDGLTLIAMDSSHVALLSLRLPAEAFHVINVPAGSMVTGLSIEALRKVLRCGSNGDAITFRAERGSDTLQVILPNKKQSSSSAFTVKLITIECDELQIPDVEHEAVVTMPSAEYQRTVRELKDFGDAVAITAESDQVVFTLVESGSSVTARIILKTAVKKLSSSSSSSSSTSSATLTSQKSKPSKLAARESAADAAAASPAGRQRPGAIGEAAASAPSKMSDESEKKQTRNRGSDWLREEAHRAAAAAAAAKKKQHQKHQKQQESVGDDDNDDDLKTQSLLLIPPSIGDVRVQLRKFKPITQSYAVKYLEKFTKAAALSGFVRLHISSEFPLVVEYPLPASGRLAFYLAAKIEDNKSPISS